MGCRAFALRAAPRVFRAPSGPAVGPGCLVCPWAAARPLAVRAASFARRVVSKPGQAPPPPTGTAARPSGPSGALRTSGAGLLACGLARCREARSGPAGLAAPFLLLLLVVPLVFRAPEGPAAREARRPHFVRRRASKPGQAPPPPTGTAAGLSGALHIGGAWCAGVWLGALS